MIAELKDFSSVSPSARWILMLKGHTDIPFARRVAELLAHPDDFRPNFRKKNFTRWAAVLHFESRYKSIDSLLDEIATDNILELSSGYSFRGLHLTSQRNVHYIDTDLPEVVQAKQNFASVLMAEGATMQGTLEFLPLNVLDEQNFREVAGRFPQGEITVVNEGLLMYLNREEKAKLCAIIHDILMERGGYWITGDIYTRFKPLPGGRKPKFNPALKQFREQHNIEANSFESFDDAEQFFNSMGFEVFSKAEADYPAMASFPYFIKSLPLANGAGNDREKRPEHRATWCLRVKN